MRINYKQLLRHLIQLSCLVLLPGLFASIWNSIITIVGLLANGIFDFSQYRSSLFILVTVTVLTALWGRFFCSYVCSFGFMQEIVSFVRKTLHIRQIAVSNDTDRILKHLKYIVVVVLMLLSVFKVSDVTYSPWYVFGNISLSTMASIGGIMLLLIMIASLFYERFFCNYLCPLGGLFAAVSKYRLFTLKKTGNCTGCDKCSKVCPMHLDVRKGSIKGLHEGDCISCFRCLDICPEKALSTPSEAAVNGTLASLTLIGMTYAGNILPFDIDQIEAEENIAENTKSEETIERGSYSDGIYTGTAKGHKGEIKVEVTVENGYISQIDILSYKDDTEFFNKARNKVIAQILDLQSPYVQAVSGATFSSNGIMNAVADALGNEETIIVEDDKPTESAVEHENAFEEGLEDENVIKEETAIEIYDSKNGSFTDGTYTGTGYGHNGAIKVSVEVENGMISEITVISSNEDGKYFNKAEGTIINSVLDSQSVNISTVSGATMSSNGILEAIADALGLEYEKAPVSNNHRH